MMMVMRIAAKDADGEVEAVEDDYGYVATAAVSRMHSAPTAILYLR